MGMPRLQMLIDILIVNPKISKQIISSCDIIAYIVFIKPTMIANYKIINWKTKDMPQLNNTAIQQYIFPLKIMTVMKTEEKRNMTFRITIKMQYLLTYI